MVKVNSRTIQRLLQGHGQFIRAADEARRYYSNVNRIKQDNSVLQRQAETEQALGNPLHLADNRISHSWHNLLVTQKVSYALSYPPVFDVGNKTANERTVDRCPLAHGTKRPADVREAIEQRDQANLQDTDIHKFSLLISILGFTAKAVPPLGSELRERSSGVGPAVYFNSFLTSSFASDGTIWQ